MCSCDFEPADVWDETKRRARKMHTCEECREQIAPGDHYIHVSYLADGHWYSHATCLSCDEIATAFRRADDGCAPAGGLFEAIEECIEGASRMPPAIFGRAMGVLVAMRERWYDERQRRTRAQWRAA